MTRDLSPLFAPSTVAVFGASGREGRPGFEVIKALKAFEDGPQIYPVTPGYDEIAGLTCFSNATLVPAKIDLGVIAGGPARIVEDAMHAISLGARALHVIGDLDAEGCQNLSAIARAAGACLLGPNSIGYIDYVGRTASTWAMPPADHRRAGKIALILQSGALFSYANSIDPRLSFSTTIHLGREVDIDVVDMIDHALLNDQTRVIGLYLENPGNGWRLGDALARAAQRGVPVVVLAPGQTRAAAEAIATHAGRMAGARAPLEAIFRRYRVVECVSLDQFWCTLHLFSAGIRMDRGVAIITDSGAQRALAIDAASRLGLPLTRFSSATGEALRAVLAPELDTANPVDIWSGEKDVAGHVAACLSIALNDENTSVGIVVTEFGVPMSDTFSTRIAEGLVRLAGGPKPVLAVGFSTRHFISDRVLDLERANVPVLDGLETSFAALSQLHRYQTTNPYGIPRTIDAAERSLVEAALETLTPSDEASTLALVEAAGIPTVAHTVADSLQAAVAAANAIGYPVVLKTAEAVDHKTEVAGVVLDINDVQALERAYADLRARIGPRVLVAAMVKGGAELALGALVDAVAGPMVMLAAGGVRAELLADRQFALAPVTEDEALDMLKSLRIAPSLEPYRGQAGIDEAAVARAVASVSRLIAAYSRTVSSIDINPLIATSRGVTAVDALLVLHHDKA